MMRGIAFSLSEHETYAGPALMWRFLRMDLPYIGMMLVEFGPWKVKNDLGNDDGCHSKVPQDQWPSLLIKRGTGGVD